MRIFYLALLFVIGLWLQWVWWTYWSIWALAPQILLILTIAIASREGPVIASSLAFAWGLFSDVMSVHLFGSEALVFTCVAYGVGLVRRQVDVSSLLPQLVLLAAISFLYFPARVLVGLIFEGHAFGAGWGQFFLIPAYNCLTAPFLFFFVDRFSQRHDF